MRKELIETIDKAYQIAMKMCAEHNECTGCKYYGKGEVCDIGKITKKLNDIIVILKQSA